MRLPLSLLAAAALLVFTMIAGYYVDLRDEEMHARHLAISTGLEKIVRYNQELNAMLQISVLEQNALRSSSYPTVYDNLKLLVGTVEGLTKELSLSDDIRALNIERQQLRTVELEVLKLIEADQWPAARRQLMDEAYVLARKIYEINSETAIGALNGELTSTAATFRHIRQISQAVRLAAVGLLLFAGLRFSSRLRREVAEQQRLRDELAGANILLEDKVRERTSALQEANRKLADLSVTDGLTGLFNRRRFDEVLYNEWQRARRQKQPLGLLMIDVDQFKLYNDRFGHQAGDDCLRTIAQVLRRSVQRSGDLIARYGGEEFVMILPGMTCAEAGTLAESIRRAVQQEQLPHAEDSLYGVVTISIGVCVCVPAADRVMQTILSEADAALYRAKHGGRNTVAIA